MRGSSSVPIGFEIGLPEGVHNNIYTEWKRAETPIVTSCQDLVTRKQLGCSKVAQKGHPGVRKDGGRTDGHNSEQVFGLESKVCGAKNNRQKLFFALQI
jgi:hypothetical protein